MRERLTKGGAIRVGWRIRAGGGGHVGGAKTFAGTYDSGAGNWGMVGRSQQGWPGYDGLKKASW